MVIFFAGMFLSCDEDVVTPAVAQLTHDPSKPCSYCGVWTVTNSFSSSTISPGTYTLELSADNSVAHPGNDGAVFNILNTGTTDISITINDALHGNGIYTLKPGVGVSCSDLYNPNDNSSKCYMGPAKIAVRISISNPTASIGKVKVAAIANSFSCVEGNSYSRVWDLNVNP